MLDLFNQYSGAFLILAVFGYGLLGGFHCLGMCGGIVALASKNKRDPLYYHLGRLLSYASVMLLIKAYGRVILELFPRYKILAITIFVFFITLLIFSRKAKVFSHVHRAFSQFSSKGRAFFTGYASIFLPCAYLYTTLLAIASLASWQIGILTLLSFWLATTLVMSLGHHLIFFKLKELLGSRFRYLQKSFIFLSFLFLAINLYNSPLFNSLAGEVIKSCH